MLERSPKQAKRIVDYWLGPEDSTPERFKQQMRLWYRASTQTDEYINAEFGDSLAQAEAGELDEWQADIIGSLALIVLFDQFSRNLYRGTSKVYQNDPLALAIAIPLIESGKHKLLGIASQMLLFHPLHHSEEIAHQDMGVSLFTHLLASSAIEWQPSIEVNLKSIQSHRQIIATHRRFPHRNKLLGRQSSPAELAYLARDARTYRQ